MTIFVDASALATIIAGERGADMLADRLAAEQLRLCSALSVWDAVAGLCRNQALSVPAARTHVRRFLDTGKFHLVNVGERKFEVAVDAYARNGKARHPAALNLGDCNVYAVRETNRAKLLLKADVETAE